MICRCGIEFDPSTNYDGQLRTRPGKLRTCCSQYCRRFGTTLLVRPRILKDDAACCQATRDELGRLCVGFCGPECVRRPVPA